MQELANHLAEIPEWITGTMEAGEWDLTNYEAPNKKEVSEIVADLKQNAVAAEKALEKPDEAYAETWKMTKAGETVFEMPKLQTLQAVVLNQFPHHRAQLGIYFRLLDISVPSTYGPSADEQ